MNIVRSASLLFGSCALAVAGSMGTAAAADGSIVVFQTEVEPLTQYDSPEGCQKLPADAHVLTNNSDEPVTIYADPYCAGPAMSIAPGHGAHVAPESGSFSA